MPLDDSVRLRHILDAAKDALSFAVQARKLWQGDDITGDDDDVDEPAGDE
jgi:hypothetical protein